MVFPDGLGKAHSKTLPGLGDFFMLAIKVRLLGTEGAQRPSAAKKAQLKIQENSVCKMTFYALAK